MSSAPTFPFDVSLVDESLKASFHIADALLNLWQGKPIPEADKQALIAQMQAILARQQAGVAFGAGTIISLLAPLAAGILETVAKAKADGQPGISALAVAAINDVLPIEITADDLPGGSDAASQSAKNQALGGKLYNALLGALAPPTGVTPDSGQAGAETLMGFAVNAAIAGRIIGVLAEFFSLGQIKEVGEFAEDIGRMLGMGRIVHTALGPALRNIVTQPADRKLRQTYRPDTLAEDRLAKALLAGRMDENTARAFIAEKGYPEDQITELIAQLTPSLKEAELVALFEHGVIDQTTASGMLKAQGNPDSIAAWKLQVANLTRQDQFRKRYCDEALKLAQQRFIAPATFASIIAKQNGPQDEQQSYLNLLGLWLDSEHRRLQQADMLYLYEHGQITLDELTAWMTDLGYNAQDQLALTLEFVSKAGGVTAKTPAQIAAAAQHLHNEHVAYVNDEFQAAYGRAPTSAELSGWVSLLDAKARTRADVKTEIKLNPNPPSQ